MPNKPGRPKSGSVLFARRVQPHLVPLILDLIEQNKIKKASDIPQPTDIQKRLNEIVSSIPANLSPSTVIKQNFFLPRHKK